MSKNERHKKFNPAVTGRYVYQKTRPLGIAWLCMLIITPIMWIIWAILIATEPSLYDSGLDEKLGFVAYAITGLFGLVMLINILYGATKTYKVYPAASIVAFLFSIIGIILIAYFGILLSKYFGFDDNHNKELLLCIMSGSIGLAFLLTAAITYIVCYAKIPNKKAWRNEKKKLKTVDAKDYKAAILCASKNNDEEQLNKLLNEMDDYIARRPAEIAAEKAREEEAIRRAQQAQQARMAELGIKPEYDGESKFDGNFWEYIGWKLLGRLVTGITLGIAYPVALCWMERWKAKHTVIKGRRIQFDGNAAELMGHWILWMFLSVITLGIFAFLIPIRMQKWTSLHSHFAGEENVNGEFDGNLLQLLGYRFLGRLITLVTLGIAYPASLSLVMRWETKHTIIARMRLRFDGNGAQLMGHWLLWMLLSIVTIGIFAWFIPVRLEKWRVSHIGLLESLDEVKAE